MIYTGNHNVFMEGGGGRDKLVGNAGNDYLIGGHGEDFLYGGAEKDVLIGGAGADIFAMLKGNDIITDFNSSDDDHISVKSIVNLAWSDYQFGNYTERNTIAFTEEYFGTIVENSGGQTIIYGATGSDVYKSIVDVEPGQLVAANFEVLA